MSASEEQVPGGGGRPGAWGALALILVPNALFWGAYFVNGGFVRPEMYQFAVIGLVVSLAIPVGFVGYRALGSAGILPGSRADWDPRNIPKWVIIVILSLFVPASFSMYQKGIDQVGTPVPPPSNEARLILSDLASGVLTVDQLSTAQLQTLRDDCSDLTKFPVSHIGSTIDQNGRKSTLYPLQGTPHISAGGFKQGRYLLRAEVDAATGVGAGAMGAPPAKLPEGKSCIAGVLDGDEPNHTVHAFAIPLEQVNGAWPDAVKLDGYWCGEKKPHEIKNPGARWHDQGQYACQPVVPTSTTLAAWGCFSCPRYGWCEIH